MPQGRAFDLGGERQEGQEFFRSTPKRGGKSSVSLLEEEIEDLGQELQSDQLYLVPSC